MNSAVMFFSGFALSFLKEVILLGLAFASILILRRQDVTAAVAIPVLFLFVFFFENYWHPVAYSLNITFTIGNAEAAKLFNIKPNTNLNDILSLGLSDFVYSLTQAGFAYAIGRWVRDKKMNIRYDVIPPAHQ